MKSKRGEKALDIVQSEIKKPEEDRQRRGKASDSMIPCPQNKIFHHGLPLLAGGGGILLEFVFNRISRDGVYTFIVCIVLQ